MLLPDHEIKKLVRECKMISPFVDHLESTIEYQGDTVGALSYGLSTYGYDIRLHSQLRIFSPVRGHTSDPKDIDSNMMEVVNAWDRSDGSILIPPHGFALGSSIEYMKMPPDITALTACKSTYIRAGLQIPSTVIEAGWEGIITLELVNNTPVNLKVYPNEGILQLLFFKGMSLPEVTYANRKGKYQGQVGITMPKV